MFGILTHMNLHQTCTTRALSTNKVCWGSGNGKFPTIILTAMVMGLMVEETMILRTMAMDMDMGLKSVVEVMRSTCKAACSRLNP
jgi:hypothetical protein